MGRHGITQGKGMKKTRFQRNMIKTLKEAQKTGHNEMVPLIKRVINHKPLEQLPRNRKFHTYAEIWRTNFRDHMVLYTKCNPVMGESWDSANYRELWGTLLPGGRMKVTIFSVIRKGYLTDRCITDIVNGVRIIHLRKDDRLTVMGMERYFNA